MKNILIVGAGAVGSVYASGLVRGGAEVTFYVRERHRASTEAGIQVTRRRRFLSSSTTRLASPRVFSTVDEAAKERWDAVWLCIPSNGVHEAGTAELLAALKGTLVVSLTPGLDDRARLAEVVPEGLLVTGLIPFLAWSERTSDPSDAIHAETVVYFPPFAACPFAGPRAAEAVSALRRGDVAAKVDQGIGVKAAFGTAFLMPLVAELESAAWSFRGFDASHRVRFRSAAGEAARVVAAEIGVDQPAVLRLAPRIVHPVALRLASLFMPLDLEAFFRTHFTKVGAQTTRTLGVYLACADLAGLGALPSLQGLLDERDPGRDDEAVRAPTVEVAEAAVVTGTV